MKGTLYHELEVNGLSAGEIWKVYSGAQLGQLVVELLPHLFEKVELVEGDGGVGSVLQVTFPLESGGPRYYKEKFVKVDDEKRVKEAKGVEGGFLELGFLSYLIRFEIVDKEGGSSSVIKSTVEYEVDDEHATNASLASTDTVVAIAQAVTNYLKEKKSSQTLTN